MSKIEKQFFEVFGIKPKKQCYYWDCPYSTGEVAKDTPMNERDCANCTNPDKEVYPQITDRILLELICIQNKYSHPYSFYGETLEFLKKDILSLFIEIEEFFRENNLPEYENFKQQVQELFKENNNE